MSLQDFFDSDIFKESLNMYLSKNDKKELFDDYVNEVKNKFKSDIEIVKSFSKDSTPKQVQDTVLKYRYLDKFHNDSKASVLNSVLHLKKDEYFYNKNYTDLTLKNTKDKILNITYMIDWLIEYGEETRKLIEQNNLFLNKLLTGENNQGVRKEIRQIMKHAYTTKSKAEKSFLKHQNVSYSILDLRKEELFYENFGLFCNKYDYNICTMDFILCEIHKKCELLAEREMKRKQYVQQNRLLLSYLNKGNKVSEDSDDEIFVLSKGGIVNMSDF